MTFFDEVTKGESIIVDRSARREKGDEWGRQRERKRRKFTQKRIRGKRYQSKGSDPSPVSQMETCQ